MIPYVDLPSLKLFGGLELHAFGLLAAMGILLGARLAGRAAGRLGLDPRPLANAAPWAVAGGLLGAHWVHVLGYHPELLERDGPLALLKIWDGFSSMGGVLGGLVTVVVAFRLWKVRLLPYLNAFALGIAPGWAVARIGCFLAHDHPGVRTDFPLAVAFPGGARHDLGLYDALVLFALAGVLWLLARRPRPEGALMGVLAIGYAIPRFFLDFLRATDVPFADGRILGLTPAQYVSFLLVGLGAWLLLKRRSAVAGAAAPA